MHWKLLHRLALSVIVSLAACGPEGGDFWQQQQRIDAGLDPRDIAEVVAQDLEDIRELPSHEHASQNMRKAFAGMFGGHDGAAVRRYIDERLHHYLTLEDYAEAQVYPEATPLPFVETHGPEASKPASPTDPGSRVRAGAFNWGVSLWFTSVANNTDVTLYAQGKAISIDSTRAGVVVIAEAYRTSFFMGDDFVDYGPSARQQTLVHEARHSDCTLGLKEKTRHALRKSGTIAAFTRNGDPMCGHTHVLCPEGPYKGVAACDKHPWGAYTAGLVYIENRLAEFDPYQIEGRLAEMLAIDMRSRLLFDAHAMFRGSLGEPDMSHSSQLVP